MNIPSKDACFQLMCDMQMPEHIVLHSIQVCRVAVGLTDCLEPERIYLDRQLVQAAALLHDITKARSFETAENHALTGGQVLTDFGYPKIADVVRQHVRLDDYSDHHCLSEAVIINYADKRVLHDRIVALDERMTYIVKRYGRKAEQRHRIRMLWGKTKRLEKRIFGHLPFGPHELEHHLAGLNICGQISKYQKLCSQLAAGSY